MKISVITVSYNAAATLTDTLCSVSRQTHPEVEHCLIDGGSTDATKEVVKAHGSHLAMFVSEPDRGLYDAMNKGARLSSGDIIGFLNSDDWYAAPDTLARVARAFDEGADLAYGDLAFVTPHPPFAVRRVWRDRQHAPHDFFKSGWQPAHPTTYVRRAVFDRIGGFDLQWRISADYAFLARAMRIPKLRITHVPRQLVNMRLGGASTAGLGAIWEANRECAIALRQMGCRAPRTTIALKLARKVPQVLHARLQSQAEAAPWRPWDE
jgi:glycosyltransferase involved in cell wall biosynthesis